MLLKNSQRLVKRWEFFLPIFDDFSSHVQNHQESLLLIYPYNPFFLSSLAKIAEVSPFRLSEVEGVYQLLRNINTEFIPDFVHFLISLLINRDPFFFIFC